MPAPTAPPEGTGPGFEFLKLVLSAVVGGIAGHLAARRTEREAAIKDLSNTIREVGELAEEYWSQPGAAPNVGRLARRLKAKLADVARINERIGRDHPTYRFSHRHRIAALRMAATGGAFDVVGRAPDMDRITAVYEVAARLREDVRDARCFFWQVPPRRLLQ